MYRIFLVALFLLVFVSMSRYVGSLFGPQFDAVDTCSHVVDGDTFDVLSGHRIRLADVDTPERGEYGFDEATNYVGDMIYGKTVYLDTDDVYFYDTTGTRIVSVVYVEVEPGTYLNLNQALLDHGLAVVTDYDNEFNPALWDARIYDITTQGRWTIIGVTFVTSLVLVYIFDRAKNRVQSGLSKGVENVRARFNSDNMSKLSGSEELR